MVQRKIGDPFPKYIKVCRKCNERKAFFSPLQRVCYKCINPTPIISYKPYKGLWSTNRKKAHERDKVCQGCGLDKFLHVHHKDKNNKNQALDNLILLCRYCHVARHLANVRHPIGFKKGKYGVRPIYKYDTFKKKKPKPKRFK